MFYIGNCKRNQQSVQLLITGSFVRQNRGVTYTLTYTLLNDILIYNKTWKEIVMEPDRKESILEAARKEPEKGYEKENREMTRGFMLTTFAALVLGMGFFLFEVIAKRTVNTGWLSVGFGAAAVQLIYEGVNLNTVWKIVLGVALGILGIVFGVLYVQRVLA